MSAVIYQPGMKLDAGQCYVIEPRYGQSFEKARREALNMVGAGELEMLLRDADQQYAQHAESLNAWESSCKQAALWDGESDREEKLKEYLDLRAHGLGRVKRLNEVAQEYKKSASSKLRARARDFSRLSERYQQRCGELHRLMNGLRTELKRAELARFSLGMTAQLRAQANTMGYVEQFFMACVRNIDHEGFDFRIPLQKAVTAIENLSRPVTLPPITVGLIDTATPDEAFPLTGGPLDAANANAEFLRTSGPIGPEVLPLSEAEEKLTRRIVEMGWSWSAAKTGVWAVTVIITEGHGASFRRECEVPVAGSIQKTREGCLQRTFDDAYKSLKTRVVSAPETLSAKELAVVLRDLAPDDWGRGE